MLLFTVQLLNRDGTVCANFYGPDEFNGCKGEWCKTVDATSTEEAARAVVVNWNEKAAGPGGIFFKFPVLADVTELGNDLQLTRRVCVHREMEVRYPVTLVALKDG